MAGWLKRLFGGGGEPPGKSREDDEEWGRRWYERKSALMASRLGREHDIVMHALIPFAVGGGLDLYYFPNGVPGTAVVTKELCESTRGAPKNRDFSCYELVMFTKEPLQLDQAKNPATAFGKAHRNINAILNLIARYALEATLNPRETCEFPADMEHVGGKCLIFDGYAAFEDDDAGRFGLLLVLEIHRSEMEFARKSGAEELFSRLKAKGFYPYSDLDRPPVV